MTLLRVHLFKSEDVQFGDALVSSAVVWFANKTPGANHDVEFTYGGTIANPQVSVLVSTDILRNAMKWTNLPSTLYQSTSSSNATQKGLYQGKAQSTEYQRPFLLSDLFEVKRGLATGANDFFVLTREQIVEYCIPSEFTTPILPSPRYLLPDRVEADAFGNPLLERPLFLLTCSLSEEEVRLNHPLLWKYLQIGIEMGINEKYLCSHRTPWYSQENRPASMFLCAYMGRQDSRRKKPFRFILNRSKAVATNAYHVLYPKGDFQQALHSDSQLAYSVWSALNAINQEVLTNEGRRYGGGLYKMEPKELGRVPANSLLSLVQQYLPISQGHLC